MSNYEKMQKELDHYKQLFGANDIATRGYKVIVKQLEQQIDFLNEFELKGKIGQAAKDDPVYERALKIFKEMPEVIMSLKDLKDKLGIEYVEKVERGTATSPQSIGQLKISNG